MEGQKLNTLKEKYLLQEERILSLKKWIPLTVGCGGIENGRVASPESETCYHNVFLMLHITVISAEAKMYFRHLRPANGSTSFHICIV